MTIIYLIRHAESQMNFEDAHIIGGRSNHTPLTPEGYAQAEKLGKRLQRQKNRFNLWYASPAVRTMETARVVRDLCAPDSPILIEDGLQEVHQSDWEGLPRCDIYTPECLARIEEQADHFCPPDGESSYDVEQRMAGFVEGCRTAAPGKNIIVFTHGWAIKCLMRFIKNWDPRMTYYTEIDNASITIIHFRAERARWVLRTLNDHAHLL